MGYIEILHSEFEGCSPKTLQQKIYGFHHQEHIRLTQKDAI